MPRITTSRILDVDNRSIDHPALKRDSVTQPSQQALKELIIRVRELAQQRLVQFAKRDIVDCKESYLFDEDHFCGIKFSLGPFKAEWRIGQNQIQFSRSGNQLGQVEVDPTQTRKAA